jgi:photosystem II stability/assembly factor-like uncharacterized protein
LFAGKFLFARTLLLGSALLLGLMLVAPLVARGEPAGSLASTHSGTLTGTLPDAQADAELTDVFFLDPEHGWAVGDRGALWSTSDGGRQWRHRESSSGCRWESIWFADAQHGWIVGGWHQPATGQSRGAVLRTRDGGQNWMPVPASTLPRLLKVRFEDSQRGWAVGEPSPLYPTGVFRSEDGGRSWAPLPGPAAGSWCAGDWPAKASKTKLGIVAGRQGRIAHLAADGLTPQTIPAAFGRSIRAIALAPHATPSAKLAAASNAKTNAKPNAQPNSQPNGGALASERATANAANAATVANAGNPSWLVGDEGLVLRSDDGGRSWHEPPTPPPSACASFDWHSVALHDGRLWVVGDPGSVVLHSGDGGVSWQLFPTGETTPLRGVRFFDRHRGWAVGALGQILATRDGGQTWKRAQGRGRAALMGLFSDESRLPLELFAQTAGNDGFLTVAELLFCRESPTSSGSSNSSANSSTNSSDNVRSARIHARPARVHAAMLEAGASGGGASERFPVEDRGFEPTADRLLAGWNESYDGRGFERLVEHLAIRLRTWRPEVVVTEDAVGDTADVFAAITRQAVLAAVQRAADPRALIELSQNSGLKPWQVKKVFGQVGGNDRGVVSLNTMQLAPRLARPIGDIAARARWQLEETPRPSPPSLAFRLILNTDGLTPSRRDIMDGIALPPGADGRRELSPNTTRADVSDLARMAQRQRTLQQLMLRGEPILSNGAWLAQLDTLAQGTSNQAAGEMYWQLGQRLHEAGQSTIALETWALLANRLPHHELADAAFLRLLEQLASGEQRHRGEMAARSRMAQAAASAAIELAVGVAVPASLGKPGGEIARSGGETALPVGGDSVRGGRMATPRVVSPATFESQGKTLDDLRVPGEKFAKLIEQTRPALFADPAVRTVWLAALRAGGRQSDIETLLRNAARPQWPEPAAKALADEWWLLQSSDRPGGEPPRLTVPCPLAATRPRLDGRLDDSLWASAAVCPLQPIPAVVPGNAGPATARIARDREFLYLSVTCQRLPRQPVAAAADSGPRPRDAALEGRDRVEFLFDVDRDYRTAFRLMCDERGWTFESAADDASWNPTWYVAAAQDDDTWTIEAAIAWNELARSPPLPGAVWALGIQRIAPGHGGQSWTGATVSTTSTAHPANSSRRTLTESSPAAFGWIRFE